MEKINSTILATIISVSLVCLIVGITIGFSLSGEYQMTTYESTTHGLGAADRFVDQRYLTAMAAHHQVAIELAKQIETKTDRDEIKSLSVEIQKNEPKLIAQLQTWQKEWFWVNRASRVVAIPNIGPKDEKVDLRFLNALIAHHEEGIAMAKEIQLKSNRKEVLDDASGVQRFLETSLLQLHAWRNAWYPTN